MFSLAFVIVNLLCALVQMIEATRTAPEATGADEVEEAVFMKMFIPKTLSEVCGTSVVSPLYVVESSVAFCVVRSWILRKKVTSFDKVETWLVSRVCD